jgi:competence protein ComEA
MSNFFKSKFAMNLLLILAGAAALSAGIALAVRPVDSPGVRILIPTSTPIPQLTIFVSGSVAAPGVYTLPPGSRVGDAVEAAGGVLDDADNASLNLARRVRDEEQVHVPKVGEFPPITLVATIATGRIDINSASSEELQRLPGVGPVLASRIIEFREQNGPFLSVDELLLVQGIGPTTYQNLKELITAGPSVP